MGNAVKILFACPACDFRARIPGRLAGKRIRCPGCAQPVDVAGAAAEVRCRAPGTAIAPATRSAAPAESTPPPRRAQPLTTPSPTQPAALVEAPRRTFLFACPSCRFYAQVPMRANGKRLRCPGCGHSSLAGTAPAATPTPTPAAAPPEPVVAAPTTATSDRIRASRPTPAAAAATVRMANPDPARSATTRRIAAATPDPGVWSATPAPSQIHIEVGGIAAAVDDEVYAPTSGGPDQPESRDEATAEDGADAGQQDEARAQDDAEAEPSATGAGDAEPGDDAGDAGDAEQHDQHDDAGSRDRPTARQRATLATTVRVRRHAESVDRPRSGGRPFVRTAMLVAVVVAGVVGWMERDQVMDRITSWRGEPRPTVAPVVPDAVANDRAAPIRASGVVVANAEIDIVPAASGTIARLPFAIGDSVAAGAIVAEVDPAIETAEVHRAQAQSALSQGLLAQARQNLVLAESRHAADRSAAEAELAGAQSRARDALARAKRQEQLLARTLSSQEDADSARELALQADAEVSGVAARIAQFDAERAGLDIQRQEIAIAEAQALADQLALDQARARLAATSVTAPIAGVVAASHANVGATLVEGAGLPLLTLSDVSRLFVTTRIAERDLGRIAVGQMAEIRVPAYPDRTFAGRVERIATCGDPGEQGATFHVRIEALGDGVALLRPAMSADVGFEAQAPALAHNRAAQ
ncbi:MAG TPA: efflux RND transporter periplasmic adaptor subunit [Planctomycetota bacterium]|nr:efflux RND transporter periplasmic adaptor subunit [Planctomycetota bacterium]